MQRPVLPMEWGEGLSWLKSLSTVRPLQLPSSAAALPTGHPLIAVYSELELRTQQ